MALRKISESTSVAFFNESSDVVEEPGFYTLKGDKEKDANGVVHETNMQPDRRVYPAADGEGFTYDPPDEGGDE